MTTPKPSLMKREWQKAVKEAAYWKKQFEGMSFSCASTGMKAKEQLDDIALAVMGLQKAVKYEKALKEILELVKPHTHLRTCNSVFTVAQLALGCIATAERQHCNNGLQCIWGDDPVAPRSCTCICGGCRP